MNKAPRIASINSSIVIRSYARKPIAGRISETHKSKASSCSKKMLSNETMEFSLSKTMLMDTHNLERLSHADCTLGNPLPANSELPFSPVE